MSKGRISEHTINNIFSSMDIVDVIGPKVQLKNAGANLTGCCPFHKEKTPSFIVSPGKQIFKCFGCGEGGNAVTFLMKNDNFTYPDALDYLAGLYNITIEYEDSDYTPEKKEDIKRRSTCINAVVESYKKQLNPEVLKFLTKKRGFTKDDIIQWNIGYAPKGGKFITDLVIDSGYFREAEELFVVGTKNSKNYDRLQDRITIPLQDPYGNFIGISGRQYTPDKKYAKYMNPSDTPLYKKENTWYGLNFAIQSIRKRGYANVVEGYTDVIAMHRKRIDNTIASCGTSITINQIKILKKYTNKIQLVLDGDGAGKKAALKLIDLFVENGFYIYIKILPPQTDSEGKVLKDKKGKIISHDPDTYIKEVAPGHKIRLNIENAQDAVVYKITKKLKSAKTFEAKALISEEVAVLLSKVANAIYRENYLQWIGKEFKDFKKPITDLLKEKVLKTARKDNDNVFHASEHDKGNYTLPHQVKDKWAKLKDDILKYGMFTYQNCIYMRRGSEGSFYFKKVTNFNIKIIQHMEDEKRPLKLVSIQNIHNRNRTFDTPSEDFVTELGFKKMLTGKGNFNWQGDGGANDFSRLVTKLYDDMGDGRMITVLGWQEEGFFALNNVVIVDGRVEKLDKNGCFEHKGGSYYIPSANHIYANNPTKFIPQKRAIYTETTRTFNEVAQQISRVHRKHSMNALLFTVASCFSDIVYNKVSFFPILFLYGEPSSGKDNLIECCQSFFGKPQTPITITGKANTDKAKIRKFAQFRNMIGHMTEYSNGSDDTDQMMKSFWDRVGYERGTIDSAVGTESIAIEMSVIFTGNDYPTNDALITRIITEEMNKTDFTDQEKEEYEKLKEMMQDGISSLTAKILEFRKTFEENFRKEFKAAQLELRKQLSDLSLPDRMITNVAVLGATFKITNEKLNYGFSYQEWLDHVKTAYKNQSNKMATGSVVSQFWDCFFDGVRSSFDTIEQHTEFSIEGDDLILNFFLTYPKYQKTHFNLFKKPALSKSVLMDKLKKSDGFKEMRSSHRYGNIRTSGYVFDINRIGIKEELIGYLAAKEGAKKKAAAPPAEIQLPFKDN